MLHEPRRSRALIGAAFALMLGAGLLALTGCGVLTEAEPAVSPDPVAEPTAPPQFDPAGGATENLAYFDSVLQQYASGEQPVEGQPLVAAIVAAGFDQAAMQVSFDRTKTGLVADTILVSVLRGSDCLIGQIGTGDRSVTATVEPAVGPDGGICLIGQTRPIDW